MWVLGIITPLLTDPAIAHQRELPPEETRTAIEARQRRLAEPGRSGRDGARRTERVSLDRIDQLRAGDPAGGRA